jgi:hypothetical protein
MVLLNQGQNTSPATCSRNKELTGAVCYLWSMKHKLSGQTWRFVPYQIPATVNYSPAYDLFSIKIDYDTPEVLTGCTTTGCTNVHLIEGEYYIKIWEQTLAQSGNTNPSVAYNVVYETIGQVFSSGSTQPVSYSGNSDVFKVYEG